MKIIQRILFFTFIFNLFYVSADTKAQFYHDRDINATYDTFQAAISSWVDEASGAEKSRRENVVNALNQIMAAHNFNDHGTAFSQFQRFLQSPYKPNLRDIYFVFNSISAVPVTPGDIAEICIAADIPPIQADPLDLILCGLVEAANNAGLSQLDSELFQSEVSWLTGNNSKKITLQEYLQKIVSDPESDCDSILNNLDAPGEAALESIVQSAVPGWTPPPLDYDSFDANLNAWIQFKYTDAASQAVAQEEIIVQIREMMYQRFRDIVPFPDFQKELLSIEPVWGGPLLYFSLSKFTSGDDDNLPVPTDALEAIFRCAGLDIMDCQPNDIDRLYTALLSHQNGGTAGSQLSDDDVAGYSNIINFILSYKGKTFDDVKAYIASIFDGFSDYAKQDLQAIIDPELNPRPYHYGEDTEYFRNDQKLLPLHPDDPEYYREHVIPSLGIGAYNQSDNIGRYRYVTGKGGEYYMTVHYNQFVRVDQLVADAKQSQQLTIDNVNAWIKVYTDPTSSLYDSHFYKEIEDLAQISGVIAYDLLNLDALEPERSAKVLLQVADVFLTILANPPPAMN